MTTSETKLQPTELAALIDLIRLVADLDDDITPDESDEIALIARQVGEETFWAEVNESALRAARMISLDVCSAAVQRREAQELIYSLLEGLAQSDGVDDDERDVLTELRRLWAIEDLR